MPKKLAIIGSAETAGIPFSITADALTQKDQVLLASQKITAIKTEADMESANPVLRLLKSTLKEMEDSRKEVKAPVVEMGKAIDNAAKTYAEPLISEENRLKQLVGGYIALKQAAQLKDIRKTGESDIVASGGEGIASLDDWDVVITDEAKAYKENPGLFELVPKKAAIINGAKAGLLKLETPYWKITKTIGVRVSA